MINAHNSKGWCMTENIKVDRFECSWLIEAKNKESVEYAKSLNQNFAKTYEEYRTDPVKKFKLNDIITVATCGASIDAYAPPEVVKVSMGVVEKSRYSDYSTFVDIGDVSFMIISEDYGVYYLSDNNDYITGIHKYKAKDMHKSRAYVTMIMSDKISKAEDMRGKIDVIEVDKYDSAGLSVCNLLYPDIDLLDADELERFEAAESLIDGLNYYKHALTL